MNAQLPRNVDSCNIAFALVEATAERVRHKNRLLAAVRVAERFIWGLMKGFDESSGTGMENEMEPFYYEYIYLHVLL